MESIFRENLIVSADDFGLSAEANENILGLLRVEKIDRVSVLIGGILEREEVREILDSGAKIDLHLSLGDASDWNGKNKRKRNAVLRTLFFLADYFSGKYGKLEVMRNWEKQILKFKDIFGKFPDGFNSHEHLHFFPPYFRIALKLAKKYRIEYLRFSKSGPIRTKKVDSLAAFILDRLWRWNFSYFKKYFMPTSDFLLSFDWIKNPVEFLDILSEKVKIEVVFHPERSDENSFILRNL